MSRKKRLLALPSLRGPRQHRRAGDPAQQTRSPRACARARTAKQPTVSTWSNRQQPPTSRAAQRQLHSSWSPPRNVGRQWRRRRQSRRGGRRRAAWTGSPTPHRRHAWLASCHPAPAGHQRRGAPAAAQRGASAPPAVQPAACAFGHVVRGPAQLRECPPAARRPASSRRRRE